MNVNFVSVTCAVYIPTDSQLQLSLLSEPNLHSRISIIMNKKITIAMSTTLVTIRDPKTIM